MQENKHYIQIEQRKNLTVSAVESVMAFSEVKIVLALLGGERGELVWAISDTFNGLMALPNLIGLIFLGGLVTKITKNYFDRKKGKDVLPMLSAYPEQNAQFIQDLAEEQAAAMEDSEFDQKTAW